MCRFKIDKKFSFGFEWRRVFPGPMGLGSRSEREMEEQYPWDPYKEDTECESKE